MNVVVTGATSFLGAAEARRCLESGHRVFAVIRPGSRNLEQAERLKRRYPETMTLISIKLEDLEGIGRLVKEPCQLWFHFGWDGAGSGNRTQQEIQQKNVGDSMCALKGAVSLGCRRFVFSGSQAEYGIRDSRMEERDPCRPVSEYGKAKVAFYQKAVEYAAAGAEIDYVHARIFSVYGPGDHPWSLVETCRKTFLAGGHIDLGDCTQLWNFLHRDDCAEALYRLGMADGRIGFAPDGKENGIYNVAALEAETRPLREYVEAMFRLCGGRGSFAYGKRPPNAEGQTDLIPSTDKLRALTGFAPQIGFEDGFSGLLGKTE